MICGNVSVRMVCRTVRRMWRKVSANVFNVSRFDKGYSKGVSASRYFIARPRRWGVEYKLWEHGIIH